MSSFVDLNRTYVSGLADRAMVHFVAYTERSYQDYVKAWGHNTNLKTKEEYIAELKRTSVYRWFVVLKEACLACDPLNGQIHLSLEDFGNLHHWATWNKDRDA